MALRGFTRKFSPLKLLTEEEIEQIHHGILDVLQESGAKIYYDEALKVFKKAGCRVDIDSKLVRFPPGLVEESLRRCPSSFRVKSRNPAHDLVMGLDNVVFINFPGRDTVDLETWESRVPARKELIDLIVVLDALPTLHIQCAYPYFGYDGIPENMKEVEGTALRLAYSTKITYAISSHDMEKFTIPMAKALGTEIFAVPTASSPLTFYTDQVSACFLAAEYDLPCLIGSGATIGSTAPASIAGALISSCAEIIPCIVLVQLLKTGTRVKVGNVVLPQNMKTGSPAFGDVGASLYNAAFNQVWRRYGIPTMAATPGTSNSKIIGFQLGYEKMMQSIISALSGSSSLQLHSSVYGEITAHPVQAILDDDMAHMIGRFIEGIEVNEESCAIDLINEVGPIPGHFLGTAHTRKWWNREQYVPRSADRMTYPEWLREGKKNDIGYGEGIMEDILFTHKVDPPLTASQEEDIEKILKEAREYYRKSDLISDTELKKYERILKEEGRSF